MLQLTPITALSFKLSAMKELSFEKKWLTGKRKILQNYVLHCSRIDSTNNWLACHAQDNCLQGSIISTEFQTQGKGRLGKKWQAKKGLSTMFSVLYRPPENFPLHLISLGVGVAICEALRNWEIAGITLKWPNDILLDKKKIGGILCESFPKGVVIGVGINVNQKITDFPKEIQAKASSLFLALGNSINNFLVLEVCTLILDKILLALEAGHTKAVLAQWESYSSSYKNIFYTNQQTGQTQAGRIQGIDYQTGNLLVKKADNQIESLFHGSISIKNFS